MKRRNITILQKDPQVATKQDRPIGNQDPRKKREHRITGTDPPGRRIRTAQLGVNILKKRQNITSLGQILRGNELGRSKNHQILN